MTLRPIVIGLAALMGYSIGIHKTHTKPDYIMYIEPTQHSHYVQYIRARSNPHFQLTTFSTKSTYCYQKLGLLESDAKCYAQNGYMGHAFDMISQKIDKEFGEAEDSSRDLHEVAIEFGEFIEESG